MSDITLDMDSRCGNAWYIVDGIAAHTHIHVVVTAVRELAVLLVNCYCYCKSYYHACCQHSITIVCMATRTTTGVVAIALIICATTIVMFSTITMPMGCYRSYYHRYSYTDCCTTVLALPLFCQRYPRLTVASTNVCLQRTQYKSGLRSWIQ